MKRFTESKNVLSVGRIYKLSKSLMSKRMLLLQNKSVEWCCVVDGGYKTACGICHIDKRILSNFVEKNTKFFKKEDDRNSSHFGGTSFRHNGEITYETYGSIKKNMKLLNIPGNVHDLTRAKIKSSYKKEALKLHPDTITGSNKKFQELNEAYDILMQIMKGTGRLVNSSN